MTLSGFEWPFQAPSGGHCLLRSSSCGAIPRGGRHGDVRHSDRRLAGRFGLGANARTLVREVLTMISTSPGGLGGFLDKFKSAGLTSEVASWLGRPDAAPIAAGQVERALGATALSGIASRLGLGQGVVSTALGYALPKIVGLLTPGGVVPAGVPAEVTAFLSPAASCGGDGAGGAEADRRSSVKPQDEPGIGRWLWPAARRAGRRCACFPISGRPSTGSPAPVANAPEPATPPPATVAQAPPPPPAPAPAVQAPAPPPPRANACARRCKPKLRPPPPPVPAPSTKAQATASPPAAAPAPHASRRPLQQKAQATAPAPQASPPPAAQAPAATTPPTTTAQAPATPRLRRSRRLSRPRAASAATPTRFALSNDNGAVRASGVVRDQDAKTSIIDALNAVFGADKVKSDIGVDKSATTAPWLGVFRAALEAIKGANVDAIFQGDKINVGGAAMETPRATRSSRR